MRFPYLLLTKTSVQNITEQSIKDSSLHLFIIFSKLKLNRTNIFFFFFYKPFPSPGLPQPTGPYSNISQRGKLSRQQSQLQPKLHIKGITNSGRANHSWQQGQLLGTEATNQKVKQHMKGQSLME